MLRVLSVDRSLMEVQAACLGMVNTFLAGIRLVCHGMGLLDLAGCI